MSTEVTNLNCPVCEGFGKLNKLSPTGTTTEVAPPSQKLQCYGCGFHTVGYQIPDGSWTLNRVEALREYSMEKKRRDDSDAARNPGS